MKLLLDNKEVAKVLLECMSKTIDTTGAEIVFGLLNGEPALFFQQEGDYPPKQRDL